MPCCDTGRNIQKYKGAAASTLQDVTDNGNTTTGDIITTTGYFIGDGSKLTGISGASAAFTLQETSDRGNTTSNVIQFTNPITSLTTSGNVIVAGNVTASKFYGDGLGLTSLNASNISTGNLPVDRGGTGVTSSTGSGSVVLNTNPTLSGTVTADTFSGSGSSLTSLNASNISTGNLPVDRGGTGVTTYTTGDILIASGTNTLSNLGLGQGGYVLTSNSTSGLPEWKSSSDLGTEVAELSNGSYILGGAYNGITSTTWSVQASNTNTADYIVARDSSGDIFVSNVNAINIRGDGSGITNSNASNISLGTLAVTRGGTGVTSSTGTGSVVLNTNPALSGTVTAGTFSGSGSSLTSLNASNINSGTLSNTYGGTGFTTYNQGDLLVGTGSGSNLKKLPKGIANYVLTVKSDESDIEWVAASSGGSSVWTTLGSDIYYNSGNVSISNSTTNHTVHLGSNVIVNDTGNYDVFRVNGNVFSTGYLLGDGSKILNLKTIKTESDTDVIITSDGGPVSYTNRFYR